MTRFISQPAAERELVSGQGKVGHLDRLSVGHRPSSNPAASDRPFLIEADRDCSVMRRDTEVCTLPQEYCRVFGDAQAARNRRNDVEHRLQIELRTTDNAQHLACCCLIFERLLQLAFAGLLGLEQPRVLDGDDGLVGKCLYELHLLYGEGMHLAAPAPDDADDNFPSEHWHGKDGSNPCRLSAHP